MACEMEEKQAPRKSRAGPNRARLTFLVILLLLLLCIYLPLRQERLNTTLLRAVIAGEAAEVHQLLNSGADPNMRYVGSGSSFDLWEFLHSIWQRKAQTR